MAPAALAVLAVQLARAGAMERAEESLLSPVAGDSGGGAADPAASPAASPAPSHCGSAEGWLWFNRSSASPSADTRWASGFHKGMDAHEPEHMSAEGLFRWAGEVLELGEDDIEAMRRCEDLQHDGMADQVYSRLVEFKAIRAKLRIEDPDMFAQRKLMLQKYLAWLLHLKLQPIESYVKYMDSVASLHQSSRASVPHLELASGLGVAHDVVIRHLCKTIEDRASLEATIRAVTKIIWIQAVFFLRHVQYAQRSPSVVSPFVLLLGLLMLRRAVGSARWLRRQWVAPLLDVVSAAGGTVCLMKWCLAVDQPEHHRWHHHHHHHHQVSGASSERSA